MMLLPKTMDEQRENADLRGTKQNIYIVRKAFMRAIQKCNFY